MNRSQQAVFVDAIQALACHSQDGNGGVQRCEMFPNPRQQVALLT